MLDLRAIPDDEWRRIAALLGPSGHSSTPFWQRQCRRLLGRGTAPSPAGLAAEVRRLRGAFRRWRGRQRLRRRCGGRPGRRSPVQYIRLRPLRAASMADLVGLWRRTPAPPGGRGVGLGTYNLGGPCISVERFGVALATLAGLGDGVRVWGLTEFRPTEGPFRYQSVAQSHGFALVWSAERPRGGGGGLALLVRHECVRPEMVLAERIRGHLAVLPAVPGLGGADAVAVAVLYAPHQRGAGVQEALETHLADLLRSHRRLVLMGDVNATTRPGDRCRPAGGSAAPDAAADPAGRTWRWLRDREDDGSLVDVLRSTAPSPPPHTRVRLYSGTTSYLDRVYVSAALWGEWSERHVVAGAVVDVGGRLGMADHDPVIVWLGAPPVTAAGGAG